MKYLPHTEEDQRAMLEAIGLSSLEDLFESVPEAIRFQGEMELPGPLAEWEIEGLFDRLTGSMGPSPRYKVYIGAGSYDHHIPALIPQLLSRSEFYTAYTPYQPELSQGTLQAIYEYQTLVARLLGLETANASLYDGASALAEAMLMTIRVTRKTKVALSRAIHPEYRRVVETYFRPTGYEIEELGLGPDGRTDVQALAGRTDLAGVAVQSPNFFGVIEDLAEAGRAVHDSGALFVTAFSEPLAYGLLKSPGQLGADIACGEGQSFGLPQSYGGPGLGMFASRMKLVRNMPGRLVGLTEDLDGRRGYVLTLATREQHIRREKATSNICTNNSLCALNAAMYMACLGGSGLKELAALNRDKAEYLKKGLIAAGAAPGFSGPTFNEFTLKMPDGFEKKAESLLEKNIAAGLSLGRWYPELDGYYLFCVTETKTRGDLDQLIGEVSQ